MGIVTDYAKQRFDEAKTEAEEFFKGPLKYLNSKTPIRKAILIEWADNVRPIVGTRWEHKLADYRGTGEMPKILRRG